MKIILGPLGLVLSMALSGATSHVRADAGVFTGSGQNLRQISSKSIKLVSIDITILPRRGPFLYDGTVQGMDNIQYDCKFELRNLTDKAEEVQVGFPINSEFAERPEPSQSTESKHDWVLRYGFIALDETTTYNVEFVRRKPVGALFVWKMSFGPHETKKLRVNYHIPMSMGLADTARAPWPQGHLLRSGAMGQELLLLADMETIGYITSTGSSWSGNVEKAVFTVLTEPFERYLERRGFMEDSDTDITAEEAKRVSEDFPVAHPWWFREISPGGWKPIEHGVQWNYVNFKPKDPIEINYVMTQLPSRPKEVEPFLNVFLKRVGQGESAIGELEKLRQFLLATYGEEPTDPEVKEIASAQRWYSPRKDFMVANLTAKQKAVLDQITKRITALKSHSNP